MNKTRLENIFAELVVVLLPRSKESIGLVKELYDEILNYKNMEEELGMDLVTAVKGAYYGIYYIHPAKENSSMEIMKGYISLSSVDKMEHSFIIEDTTCCLSFLDYGKKGRGGWALTEEELK